MAWPGGPCHPVFSRALRDTPRTTNKKLSGREYTRLLAIMSCDYRDSLRSRILDGMAPRAMPSSILASFREYAREYK